MNDDEIEARLRESTAPLASQLGEALRERQRSPVRAAVRLWTGPDPALSDRAMAFLLTLEDLAIAPLLEARPPTANDRVWALTMAVDAESALRRRLIAAIDVALDDKTPVVVAVHHPVEEVPPPRRVCDEAFLLMRSVVQLGEDLIDSQAEGGMFLALTDAEKDAVIARARASSVWRCVLLDEPADP